MITLSSDLYVFVEGQDDERLIEKIFEKCFKKFNPIIFKYIHADVSMVRDLICRLNSNNENYVMLVDRDDATCIPGRKRTRIHTYDVREENVFVVDISIESWYVSGVNHPKFDLSSIRSETINKDEFDHVVHRHNHTPEMIEITKKFDTGLAISKNYSFKYFYKKLKILASAS